MRIPRRFAKPIYVWVSVGLLVIAAAELAFEIPNAIRLDIVGLDIGHYLDGTRRFLEHGSPYLPSEVAAPFQYQPLTFMHPPISLYLFIPFLLLPIVLWWLIPVGLVLWSLAAWRPAPWAWPILAAAAAYPRFHIALIVGNSDLWAAAFLALGLRFGWPGILVAVKPSFGPLFLVGAAHRSWWWAAGALAVASVPFGALWLDWISVVRNAPGGLLYSLPNVAWLLAPLVAWLARRRPDAPMVIDRVPSIVGGFA